ncbi:hypothetical protein UF75_2227 [Desulfosporosinus sp. I2]|uniref:hypothetical protein n=1 Tax=Desulfosporosinus sp. I2 TaxID=1617025 RepID=UPI00061E41F4|nr:hypothetical protein [Desulfosporosinus sp. I2]KJR47383.1 hypothetical protein UF75_2227 [Desulfosporosinus sp. I2]
MDISSFEKVWETEYLCDRVKRITEDVKKGNYECALDYLRMIRQKAADAEYFIKHNSPA